MGKLTAVLAISLKAVCIYASKHISKAHRFQGLSHLLSIGSGSRIRFGQTESLREVLVFGGSLGVLYRAQL